MPSHYYYLCYSPSDEVFAKTLAAKLRQYHIPLFVANIDLKPGDDLDIIASEAVVLIVVVSRFGIIDRKLLATVEQARQNKQKVIPLIVEDCTLPPIFKRQQPVSFVQSFEPGIQELVKAAKKSAFIAPFPGQNKGTPPRKNFFKSVLDTLNVFKSNKQLAEDDFVGLANPASKHFENMFDDDGEVMTAAPPNSPPIPEQSGAEPPPANPSKGKVLYDIPDAMLEHQATRCVVRIGKNEQIVLDDDNFSPAMRLQEVPIARVMEVNLVDIADTPRFHIKTINSAEMEVDNESYTEWLFWVTPLTTGTYPLVLKVSVLKIIDGKERRKELVFEKEVNINSVPQQPALAAQPLVSKVQTTPLLTTLGANGPLKEVDPPVVFISYAHKDKAYVDLFVDYLKTHSGWTIWTDRNIEVGSDWYQRIQQAISQSDMAVLLISAGFISSGFINKHEFSGLKALEKQKPGFTFLPILLRDADFTRWQDLATLQLFVAYGHEYGVPEMQGKMIPFAQLCRFDTAGQLIPNTHIDTYFKNLVAKAGIEWLKKQVRLP